MFSPSEHRSSALPRSTRGACVGLPWRADSGGTSHVRHARATCQGRRLQELGWPDRRTRRGAGGLVNERLLKLQIEAVLRQFPWAEHDVLFADLQGEWAAQLADDLVALVSDHEKGVIA